MSSWLAFIWTVNQRTLHHHLPNLHDIDLSHTGWRPLILEVIFHFLATIFELLARLKNMCPGCGIISKHLLEYIKCFWRSSCVRPDKKIQVSSLLYIHNCRAWNKVGVNKSKLKKKICWQKNKITVMHSLKI